MTSLLEPAPTDPAAPLAQALDEVRRSAQTLLAEIGGRPRALRIKAGDVVVEMEWTEPQQAPAPVSAATAPAPVAIMPAAAAPEVVIGIADEPSAGVDICAPIVGTFYRAPEPGAAPFVSEGDQVKRGQQVGIVEAMKLMIPVEAEGDGRVVALHVTDCAPVEFGQRLITVDPTAG